MKKQFAVKIVVGVVLAGLMASPVFAGSAEFPVPIEKTDIVCTGKTIYQRSIWARVLSFGILSKFSEVNESIVVPKVPGGISGFRFLLSRNPEMPAVLAKLADLNMPTAINSDFTCTSSGKEPLEISFYRNSAGQPSYDIN
ncbi:MAG: hypothetical protein M0Z78_08950 [Betaproteobacteria bacterium]|nr:hypothetical protein [Betaproteobacteria bacterium]